ncbi:TPA: hypothetical protein ACP32N_003264 [Pseudomonas aeruginosa]
MNNKAGIILLALLANSQFAISSDADQIGTIAPINYKAFRDAVIAGECVKRKVLPESANRIAYDRLYSLDPKAALLIDSGYGIISIYLGDHLNNELHKSIDSLDVMNSKTLNVTCRFTNLRNLAGGTDPSISDATNAHVKNEETHKIRSSADIQSLISEFDRLNDECRGGSGDNPKTMDACNKRDSLYKTVEAAGWCYGENSTYGYQKTWNPCLENKN